MSSAAPTLPAGRNHTWGERQVDYFATTTTTIRKHDHYTPAREIRRDVRALAARNHPEGRYYPVERHALTLKNDRRTTDSEHGGEQAGGGPHLRLIDSCITHLEERPRGRELVVVLVLRLELEGRGIPG